MDASQILSEIKNFSNLVRVVLTLPLLSTTSFYAWVSYRLLKETAETRRAAIGSLLWLDLSQTTFDRGDEPAIGAELDGNGCRTLCAT
jgi:hypothetical protein